MDGAQATVYPVNERLPSFTINSESPMIMIQRIAAALGALALSLGAAFAAQSAALTSAQVERFIASMPEMVALGEKHDDGKPRNIDPGRPLSSSLELMGREDAAYTDLAQLASRHGFSSVEQWADVGDRTMNAYAVASSGMPASDIEAAYRKAVADISNHPDMPAAQKEAILAGMKKGHQRNMNTLQATEQDLAAVRPHMAELDKLFD